MELLSAHILKKENSYFVLLIKRPLNRYKRLHTYNDGIFFYSRVKLRKHWEFRFRVRTFALLKTWEDISWIRKLFTRFICTSSMSFYIPEAWARRETREDAEDRLGTTIFADSEEVHQDD